jgi:gluconate 2-dehydrogenase gamma chain
MDTLAKREHGGSRFHELSGDQQDEIMTRFQTGKVDKLKFPQARFFTVVSSFAFEGYMSPPKYGGNFNKLAWKAHGFDLSCHHMFAPCKE